MADTPKPSGASIRAQLVNLVAAKDYELFHSPDGHPFATFMNGTHRETLSLIGPAFPEHLSREYYRAKKKVVNGTDLKDAIRVLSASAKHSSKEHRIFVRLARVDDVIWLDLGQPDWGAIKITPTGWAYVAVPDVKFRRTRGLLALPSPSRGTEPLGAMLTRLINVTDPMLIISWLVGALRGRKPYPIMALNGEQGVAKSYTSRVVRRTIDPNVADLRLPPKEPRDLMIAALNSHIIAFDNLSVIPEWLSDALCVIATGGGFSTRELYSDLDETLFSAERPILLNGINNVVTRPDLLDRALVVTLEPIPDELRKSESALDADFVSAHPGILAALLDAVSCALAREATTDIGSLPRMADFATWVEAAAPSLGWAPDQFLAAYRANQDEAIEAVLEGDVVVDAIRELSLPWTGQLKDLFFLIPEHEYKPKSPRGLRGALVRKAPALRHVGITLTFTKGHVHTVTIGQQASLPALHTKFVRMESDDVPF